MKSFLLGRNIIIFAGNCPLCYMMDKKTINKHVEKISLLLQEFNLQQIIHIKGKFNCLPDYLSRHPVIYDDELLDSEYGLGFVKDNPSSSIHLFGAVVTKSKPKAVPTTDTSSCVNLHQQQSSSFTITSTRSGSIITYFNVKKLKQHQQSDYHIQKIIVDLKKNPNISFAFQDGILYRLHLIII